jgi:hypothetical protein
MLSKELAKDTLPIVALDRITDTATCYNAQTWGRICLRNMALKNERSAVDTMTQTADFLKFAWLA